MRDRWIATVLRLDRVVLIAAALLTAFALHLAAQLRIDTDLRALLPSDDPALVELDRVETTLGTLGSVNVVVAGGERGERHALADALAERLTESPLVREVEYRVPGDFFADHALYYLGAEALAELTDHLEAWKHHELCTVEPDLCLSPPDPRAPEALRELLRRHEATARARAPFHDYFERDDIPALVMLVHPTHSSSDLEFARRVTAESRTAVAEVLERADAQWSDAVRVNLVGPYIVKADEHATIREDMLRGALFGVGGVLLILYVLLRSPQAVLTLVLPLACGVTWSMAWAQLMFGHLNSLTSLISTVIMGLGIDAGIHLLLRVRAEPPSVSDREAIARAFGELFTPLLVASATTLAAFCVMAGSTFPAFREFGLIAAAGIVLCLLAMLTVYPAALSVCGVRRSRRPVVEGALVRRLLRRPARVLAVAAVITAVTSHGSGRVAFEGNSREFQSARTRAQGEADALLIREILGHDIHAGVLVVDTLEQARDVLQRARSALTAAGERSLVDELFAAPDLLPDPGIDAEQRRMDIAALAEDIPTTFWSRLDHGDDVARLRRMLAAAPVSVDRLPPALRARVRGADGSFPVYAFPNYDAADITLGADFMSETANYAAGLSGPPRTFVGEMTVYARMYRVTMDEAPLVIVVAAGLIALVVLLQLRSVGLTLLTLLPLVLGVLWLVGTMGLTGVHFTLFNIPIVPVILGIGVDNGVYLTAHVRRTRGAPDGLAEALVATGAAILAATATTAIGFGAFMVADNGGLRSIGRLAVLGTLLAALAALLVIPGIVAASTCRRRGPIAPGLTSDQRGD